jgi:pyruvate dehydrogenase (quinone)
MITVAKYYSQWSDPRLVVAVLHNDDLNQVTWEQRAMEGSPKFIASQKLPDVDYAAFAASLGLHAIAVDDPDAVGPAWDSALSADRPTLLDVRCDPDIPPIPPHATLEQARKSAEALFKGDEDAVGILEEGFKEKLVGLLPGRRG